MKNLIIKHYHQNAASYAVQYNSVAAATVHSDWSSLIHNKQCGRALDVGAGSGRDAQWLSSQGWRVTAVEPADALRELAAENSDSSIIWCDDSLPELSCLKKQTERYDLILLSAVWMHIPQYQRAFALQSLYELMAPNGLMVITLRLGPSDMERPMYEVSAEELAVQAEEIGLIIQEPCAGKDSDDQLQRTDIRWKTLVLYRSREGMSG